MGGGGLRYGNVQVRGGDQGSRKQRRVAATEVADVNGGGDSLVD